jgi:hypothetical protein
LLCYQALLYLLEAYAFAVVECDLRWGVLAQEAATGRALEICLSEVERCDLFVGILGGRAGVCCCSLRLTFLLSLTVCQWTPKLETVPAELRQKYGWREGSSVTAMEMETALRKDGFMIVDR